MPEVFSAHAEVVPCPVLSNHIMMRILRARGGSSGTDLTPVIPVEYSPRTRR